jgi:hypothetical protein
MSVEYVYGNKGQMIGYLREDSSGTKAYGVGGKYLGSYWNASNQTQTDKGQRVCFGDGARGLIMSQPEAFIR